MKLFEKFTKRFASTASDAVKVEIKRTAIDLLPKIISIGAMIVSALIFKEAINDTDDQHPMVTNTRIVTNNYFFNDISEDTILRIIEEDDD